MGFAVNAILRWHSERSEVANPNRISSSSSSSTGLIVIACIAAASERRQVLDFWGWTFEFRP